MESKRHNDRMRDYGRAAVLPSSNVSYTGPRKPGCEDCETKLVCERHMARQTELGDPRDGGFPDDPGRQAAFRPYVNSYPRRDGGCGH